MLYHAQSKLQFYLEKEQLNHYDILKNAKLKKIIKSFDSKLNKKSKEQNKYKLKEGCFV